MIDRTGLRIRAHKVDAEIGDAFKAFAKWLRRKYRFPIRVPVYLSNKEKVVGRDGESSVSIFFAPFDNKVEPYIRIATGDYKYLVKENGKENAQYSLLHSLALGIVEYQKWLDDNAGLDVYDPDHDATELIYEYIDELGQ